MQINEELRIGRKRREDRPFGNSYEQMFWPQFQGKDGVPKIMPVYYNFTPS